MECVGNSGKKKEKHMANAQSSKMLLCGVLNWSIWIQANGIIIKPDVTSNKTRQTYQTLHQKTEDKKQKSKTKQNKKQ